MIQLLPFSIDFACLQKFTFDDFTYIINVSNTLYFRKAIISN